MSEAASPQPPMTRPNHVVSQRTQTLGMIIFLISLGVLFAATMVVYLLIRLLLGQEQPPLGYLRPALTNWKLFLSTAVVLGASATIHLALRAIRRERRGSFLQWLVATDVLAVVFVAVQIPAMLGLLALHGGTDPAAGEPLANPDRFYGITVFMILLHALHVVGGIIYLALVTAKAARGGYDHESHRGVAHAALYWHFLDVVWLVMFGTLLLLG